MAALPPLSVTGGDAAPSGSGSGTGGVQVGGLTVNKGPSVLFTVGIAAAVAFVVVKVFRK